MTKKTFVIGIEYLNAYYTNFKVDINNELVQKIWYEALKEFSDKMFTIVIQEYCKNNVYAPQSPTHLLHFYNDYKENYTLLIESEISKVMSKALVYDKETDSYRYDYEIAKKEVQTKELHAIINALKTKELQNWKKENLKEYLFSERVEKNILIDNTKASIDKIGV